jgi:hypothetical protein
MPVASGTFCTRLLHVSYRVSLAGQILVTCRLWYILYAPATRSTVPFYRHLFRFHSHLIGWSWLVLVEVTWKRVVCSVLHCQTVDRFKQTGRITSESCS